eukprot:TRINITY_DN5866_c0_g1_i1.p1 TRINITY_DN5866_c0_g1~~TRINITY_DN5866_c0_g1_i1.p1  ORF type:complete len:455 (+),score=153.64 TRINITY_DN5866_c0_g1_i1:146-1510(+)
MPSAAMTALAAALGRDDVLKDMIDNLDSEYKWADGRPGWVLCHEEGAEVTLESFRLNVLVSHEGGVLATLDGVKVAREGRRLVPSDPAGQAKSVAGEDELAVQIAGREVKVAVLMVTRVHLTTSVMKLQDPRSSKIRTTIRNFSSALTGEVDAAREAGEDVNPWLPGKVLAFFDEILGELRVHPLWADADEQELKEADDVLQKYVLKKLYDYTFANDKATRDLDASLLATLKRYPNCPLVFRVPAACRESADFPEAVSHLVGVDQWKSPLDKLTSLSNCCKVLSRCCGTDGLPTEEQLTFTLAHAIHAASPKALMSNLHYIVTYRPTSLLADSDSGYFLRCVRNAAHRWLEFSAAAGDVCQILSEAQTSLGRRGFALALPDDPEQISLVDIQPLLLHAHALSKMEHALRRYAGLPTSLEEEMRKMGGDVPEVPEVPNPSPSPSPLAPPESAPML